MLSEEEKKAIDYLKKYINWETYGERSLEADISTILNLIEKQQKEIEHWKAGMKIVERDKNNHIERLEKELDNIKEIEKSHKEENGLLRQELDMQIEHNKELEATLKQTQNSWFEDTQKLEQEKEKNKELEATNKAFHHFIMFTGGKDIKDISATEYMRIRQEGYIDGRCYEQQKAEEIITNNYISKDKIKEKYLEMEQEYAKKVYDNNYNRTEVKKEEMYKRQVYEELLEEK